MSTTNNDETNTRPFAPGGSSESADFAEPLGEVTRGRLVFASGAAGITILADPALPDLYRAHFERHVPRVWSRQGIVTVQYRRFPFFDWLVYHLREPVGEVILNGSIPWEFEFRDGVSRLVADLRQLQFPSLDVLGGASSVSLALPSPVETAFVHFAGGASDLTIHRPHGVAVRVQIGSGVSRLRLDEQYFGAIGGETRLETPGFKTAGKRYDICIAGGASNVTIS